MSPNDAVDGVATVEQMCQRWSQSYEELLAAYRAHLSEDCRYVAQQGMDPVIGPEQAVAVIEQFHQGFGVETIEVDMLKIHQAGDQVWTERIDYMVDAKGERFLELPIAGVMTLGGDGRLVDWIDYWDMRELLSLADGS